MKKNIKLFIGILIGLVLGVSAAVGATALYNSSEVGFTPTDKNWKVNNMEDAINDLYNKEDIKTLLDSKTNSFGGQGVSFSGFTIGHKYLAIYASNFWNYGAVNTEYTAYLNSGAEDVKIISGGCDTAERTNNGGRACAYLISFKATANSVTINYGVDASYYSMRFIDIT